MPVSSIFLTLLLAATPPGSPSRLDPDNIEALEALLRAMDAQAEATGDEPVMPASQPEAAPAAEDEPAAATGTPPARLDPDNLEALEELLRAMDAQDGIVREEPAREEPAPEPDMSPEPAEPEPDPAPVPLREPAEDVEAEATDEPVAPQADRLPEAARPQALRLEPEDDEAEAPVVTAPERENAAVPRPAPQPVRSADAGPAPRTMGPHVSFAHYEGLRGARWGEGIRLDWQVAVTDLGETGAAPADSVAPEGAAQSTRTFIAGNGWAGETSDTSVSLYDFTARRALQLDREAGSYTNTSLYAGVRRNIDIYVALSRGGQAEDIAFGASGSFHRFWLESAMSVAAAPAGLTRTSRDAQAGDGPLSGGRVTSWYRGSDGQAVASVWTGCEGVTPGAAQHRSLITAFAHRLALHPDIIAALRDGEPVCALSFTVISPESPQGRTELWQLADSAPFSVEELGFAEAELSFGQSALVDARARQAMLDAIGGSADSPPSPPEFMVEIQALQRQGDLAGAMLTLVQETAHFGLCPSETVGSERLACAGAAALAEAGTGNAGFDAVSEAVEAAAEGSHRLAVERLLPYLERRDYAGSAARTIVARQLVEWGEEGLDAHPGLDPAALLSEALVIDPYAVNIYWYLALRYLAGGAPEEAWLFLDSARALPARVPTETLQQVNGLESRLQQLAPALFPG